MGSGGQKPPEPKAADPVARAPRPGDEGQSGSASRRSRLRALSRLGPRASIIAGETGGFVPANTTRAGNQILGG